MDSLLLCLTKGVRYCLCIMLILLIITGLANRLPVNIILTFPFRKKLTKNTDYLAILSQSRLEKLFKSHFPIPFPIIYDIFSQNGDKVNRIVSKTRFLNSKYNSPPHHNCRQAGLPYEIIIFCNGYSAVAGLQFENSQGIFNI